MTFNQFTYKKVVRQLRDLRAEYGPQFDREVLVALGLVGGEIIGDADEGEGGERFMNFMKHVDRGAVERSGGRHSVSVNAFKVKHGPDEFCEDCEPKGPIL